MFLFSRKINFKFLTKIIFFTKNLKLKFIQKYLFHNQKIILFNQSRWSLLFIVFLYNKFFNLEKITIWVPSYYCNYALSKIKIYFKNVEFFFYPVDKNLEIDLKRIKLKDKKINPNIFINVHYFGKVISNSNVLNFYNKSSCWVINDCTHCLSPDMNFEKSSDFSIYSPYKFYSIPAGAICKINLSGPNKFFFIDKFDKDGNIAKLKKEFLNTLNLNNFKINFVDFLFNIFWLTKKLVNLFLKKITIQNYNQEDNGNYKQNIETKPFPNFLLKKIIINSMMLDIKIGSQREKTYFVWKTIIKLILKNNFKYVFFEKENDSFENYYQLIIKCESNHTEEIYNYLQNLKVPISTWPDLAPELENDNDYVYTYYLKKNLIFINLHPQLNEQLKFLRKNYNEKIVKSESFELTKVILQKDWKFFLDQVEYSYVTSLKSYYITNKFFKSERYLIKKDGSPIAIFQIYFFSIVNFYFLRINMGPLFFNGISTELKKKIVNFMIEEIYKKKFRILFISPNLAINELNTFFVYKNRFFLFNENSWQSISLNLLNNLKYLKMNLKDSLRRDIKRKNRLQKLKISKILSQNDFNQFIIDYERQKKISSFQGVSSKILASLFDNKKLIILNAFIGEEKVSTICIVMHGRVATYLVGLNFKKKNSANDLLLWKIIVLLKKKGFKYFDFGGVDFLNNKKVSLFKLNFGGKIYKLSGSKIIIL